MNTELSVSTPDSGVPSKRIALSKALITKGMLSQEQLAEVAQKLQITPYLNFKQVVSFLCKIPMESLDRVDLEGVILPLLAEELKNRLRDIAHKDRFARSMDIDRYLEQIEAQVLSFETRFVESRAYEADKADQCQVNRFEITEASLSVELHTADGQSVTGKLRISHHSHEGLTIAHEDDDLKGTIYYSLRQAFTNLD